MGNTRDAAFVPEVLEDAIRANFRGKDALFGSGAVMTRSGLAPGVKGGDKIDVPYFNLLGELETVAEGVDLTVKTIPDGEREQAVVARAGKAITLTDWKRAAEAQDPYSEYVRQFDVARKRHWDSRLIAAAVNQTGLPAGQIIDRYSAGSPIIMTWQYVIDGRKAFGDEQDDLALILVHSKGYFDLVTQVDSQNRPILVNPVDGDIVKVGKVTVAVSDRCPVAFPTAPTATGTAPPAVTITGSNTLAITDVRVEVTTTAARGTAVFKYSFDGGITYSETGVVTAATYEMLLNGSPTGLTLNFAAGNYTNDNLYVSLKPKFTTILVKKDALLLWYSSKPTVELLRQPKSDSTLIVTNTYYLSYRYKRSLQSTRPGVVLMLHN